MAAGHGQVGDTPPFGYEHTPLWKAGTCYHASTPVPDTPPLQPQPSQPGISCGSLG